MVFFFAEELADMRVGRVAETLAFLAGTSVCAGA